MLHRNRIASIHINFATSQRRRNYDNLQKLETKSLRPNNSTSKILWYHHRSSKVLQNKTFLSNFPHYSAGASFSRSFSGTMSLSNKGQQRLPHDLGGSSDFLGSIPVDDTDTRDDHLQAWERECHALFAVLASKAFFNTDQLRRAVEALTPHQYASWSYYGTLLLDRGLISDDDLRGALFGKTIENRLSSQQEVSRFRPGDMVRVKSYQQGVEWRRPHIRTPGYIYGVKGRIVDVCGKFGDPSFLAFGIEPPKIWLYRVVRSNFSPTPFFGVGDVGLKCFCSLQLI
jgi:hypothetical protein